MTTEQAAEVAQSEIDHKMDTLITCDINEISANWLLSNLAPPEGQWEYTFSWLVDDKGLPQGAYSYVKRAYKCINTVNLIGSRYYKDEGLLQGVKDRSERGHVITESLLKLREIAHGCRQEASEKVDKLIEDKKFDLKETKTTIKGVNQDTIHVYSLLVEIFRNDGVSETKIASKIHDDSLTKNKACVLIENFSDLGVDNKHIHESYQLLFGEKHTDKIQDIKELKQLKEDINKQINNHVHFGCNTWLRR